METIDVIPATIDDIKKLQEIGRRTFEETFSSGNNEENLKVYLEESFSRNKLRAELRTESSHFYFAVLENHINRLSEVKYRTVTNRAKRR